MSAILAQLKALKLHGMAGCYADLQQQITPEIAAEFESSGKTHLAIAIGTSGIQHQDKKVRFGSRH